MAPWSFSCSPYSSTNATVILSSSTHLCGEFMSEFVQRIWSLIAKLKERMTKHLLTEIVLKQIELTRPMGDTQGESYPKVKAWRRRLPPKDITHHRVPLCASSWKRHPHRRMHWWRFLECSGTFPSSPKIGCSWCNGRHLTNKLNPAQAVQGIR